MSNCNCHFNIPAVSWLLIGTNWTAAQSARTIWACWSYTPPQRLMSLRPLSVQIYSAQTSVLCLREWVMRVVLSGDRRTRALPCIQNEHKRSFPYTQTFSLTSNPDRVFQVTHLFACFVVCLARLTVWEDSAAKLAWKGKNWKRVLVFPSSMVVINVVSIAAAVKHTRGTLHYIFLSHVFS